MCQTTLQIDTGARGKEEQTQAQPSRSTQSGEEGAGKLVHISPFSPRCSYTSRPVLLSEYTVLIMSPYTTKHVRGLPITQSIKSKLPNLKKDSKPSMIRLYSTQRLRTQALELACLDSSSFSINCQCYSSVSLSIKRDKKQCLSQRLL